MLRDGHRVICIDNFLTGSPANIEHLRKHSRFQFIQQDVTEYLDVPGKVDYIFHFASPASPIDYLRLPIPTLKVGALGTHKVLGLAKAKQATFLLASTSEVYGDPLVHPQCEDYWGNVNPVGPRSVYDEAKRFAEAITMAYHRAHGLDTKIARIFNTYGPRMRPDDGRLIPTFLNQILQKKPLTVFGNGQQTRSFCYVTDLIEGIIRLGMSHLHDPVNLGNPQEMTVLQFAETILRLTRSKNKIVYRPLPIDDPHIRQPDITRARSLLHWQPRTPLSVGLRKTIEYFKRNCSRARRPRLQ